MPSRLCPECGKVTTCNITPNHCAWCGCSLSGSNIDKKDSRQKERIN